MKTFIQKNESRFLGITLSQKKSLCRFFGTKENVFCNLYSDGGLIAEKSPESEDKRVVEIARDGSIEWEG
jgi:hypothetical protein